MSPRPPADIVGIWPDVAPALALNRAQGWDGIWTCHVLEHSPNPGLFLTAIRRALRVGGWLAVTVPPAKTDLVGGHLTLWTPGLLLYHLVLAGLDCREARLGTYGYNISVIVRRREDFDLPALTHDSGDLERLAQYFPVPVHQDCSGLIGDINWRLTDAESARD